MGLALGSRRRSNHPASRPSLRMVAVRDRLEITREHRPSDHQRPSTTGSETSPAVRPDPPPRPPQEPQIKTGPPRSTGADRGIEVCLGYAEH